MRGFSKGQAAIALSLALPIVVAAACFGGDSVMMYRQRMELQATADCAVLLGAAYLPGDPVKAAMVASQYAEHRDVKSRIKVIYERVSTDHRSLTMVVRQRVHYLLGRRIGAGHDVVVAKATARTGSVGSATSTAKSRSRPPRPFSAATTLSRGDSQSFQAHTGEG